MVRFILARGIGLREDLVDGAAGPVEELARTGANRVLADRAQEPLVGLAVGHARVVEFADGESLRRPGKVPRFAEAAPITASRSTVNPTNVAYSPKVCGVGLVTRTR